MYSVGLDIGIASVGWSVIDSKTGRIVDLGVSLFSARNSENNLERREHRGSRRLLRRRATRLHDTQSILRTIEVTECKEIKNVCPYELRVKGLTEQLTKPEIYKVVTHIIKKRGISYLDEESEEGASERKDYKLQVQRNQKLLQDMTPGEIQLQRLQENGRVKTGIDNHGNYQLNVFTVSAYAKELEKILRTQQTFYPDITEEFIEMFIADETAEKAGLVYRKRPYYHGPGNAVNNSPYGRWADYQETGKPSPNIFDKLIGTDITGNLRASSSSFNAQVFNLLNDLNNLSLPRENPKLTKEEKESLIGHLMNDEISRFGPNDLAKFFGYSRDQIKGWRRDNKDRPEVHNLKFYRQRRDVFAKYGIDIQDISYDDLNTIAKVLTLNTEKDAIIQTLELDIPDLAPNVLGVVANHFRELKAKDSASQWHHFSIDLMNQLIPMMIAEPKEQNTVLEELNIKKALRDKYATYDKMPMGEVLAEVYNPTVKKSVRQTLNVFHAIVKKYGKNQISHVTIEMPRDKNEDEEKVTIRNIQKANAARKESSETYFLEKSGWTETRLSYEMRKKGFAAKLGYYYEQKGQCAYSGKAIKPEELVANGTEIDHVIPLSISFDDSINNKVLVLAKANQEKGQRTPFQAFHEGANLGQSWADYEAWVNLTYSKKYKKKNLLESRDIYANDVRTDFIQRNINDTRYASRVALNTVQSFFHNSDTKVNVVTGSYTHTLRKKWGDSLEKNRETHHHHAVDATLCAVHPFVRVSPFHYHIDGDGRKMMIDTETGESYLYQDFKKMKLNERRTYVPKFPDFIGQLSPTLLYPKIKFHHQVDRKSNRKISDATIYSTRTIERKVTKRGKEVVEKETYTINKIKDIYTVAGWKEFDKYKDRLLAKDIDPKTYEILCDIADNYVNKMEVEEQNGKIKTIDCSPFERYCHDNDVQGVQKYSKKGNGPFIRSLKYYKEKTGSHINISRDEQGQPSETTKNGKKVVLLSINPWRTDVYYNQELEKFELMGLKYSHLRWIDGKYGVPRELYEELKELEKVSPDSEFRFSLYRKDGLIVESDDERIETLFHSRNMVSDNYVQLKPINRDGWEKNKILPVFGKSSGQLIKGIKPNMKLTKFNTDYLGNKYYVIKEELKDIL